MQSNTDSNRANFITDAEAELLKKHYSLEQLPTLSQPTPAFPDVTRYGGQLPNTDFSYAEQHLQANDNLQQFEQAQPTFQPENLHLHAQPTTNQPIETTTLNLPNNVKYLTDESYESSQSHLQTNLNANEAEPARVSLVPSDVQLPPHVQLETLSDYHIENIVPQPKLKRKFKENLIEKQNVTFKSKKPSTARLILRVLSMLVALLALIMNFSIYFTSTKLINFNTLNYLFFSCSFTLVLNLGYLVGYWLRYKYYKHKSRRILFVITDTLTIIFNLAAAVALTIQFSDCGTATWCTLKDCLVVLTWISTILGAVALVWDLYGTWSAR